MRGIFASSWEETENSPQNQADGGENQVFLEGDKLEVAGIRGRWVLTHLPADPDGGGTAAMLFSRRLKRRCTSDDTLTETTLQLP
jgi:hypothetical protein